MAEMKYGKWAIIAGLALFSSIGCNGNKDDLLYKQKRDLVVYLNDTLLAPREYGIINCHGSDGQVHDGDILYGRIPQLHAFEYIIRDKDTIRIYNDWKATKYSEKDINRDRYYIGENDKRYLVYMRYSGTDEDKKLLYDKNNMENLSSFIVPKAKWDDLITRVIAINDKNYLLLTSCAENIPKGIKYLNTGWEKDEASNFKPGKDLRFLILSSDTCIIDMAKFSKLSKLVHLEINSDVIKTTNDSCRNTSVRTLSIATQQKDISFIKSFAKIDSLEISGEQIHDLSFIESLGDLRVLIANWSQINKLPLIKHPNLKILRILSAKLEDESFNKFIELNPQCFVQYRWSETYLKLSSITSRIVITNSLFNKENRTYVTINDPIKVKEIIKSLKFIDSLSVDQGCLCVPIYDMSFYKGSDALFTLGIHGDCSTNAYGYLRSVELTTKAKKYLIHLLKENNIKKYL